MTFDSKTALALAEQLEQADRAMTKGEWTGEVDCFAAEEGIVALVADRETSMLFTAGTEVPLHQQDGETWSTEDSIKRDAQWAKARQTQALQDAKAIATLRNLAADCARALREAVEECERLGRVVAEENRLSVSRLQAQLDLIKQRDQLQYEIGKLKKAIERHDQETTNTLAHVVTVSTERDAARAECEAMRDKYEASRANRNEERITSRAQVDHLTGLLNAAEAARSALAAEVERFRGVYEAAVHVRDMRRRKVAEYDVEYGRARFALDAAVDEAMEQAIAAAATKESLASVRARHGFSPLSEEERRENLAANLDDHTPKAGKP